MNSTDTILLFGNLIIVGIFALVVLFWPNRQMQTENISDSDGEQEFEDITGQVFGAPRSKAIFDSLAWGEAD